MNKPREIKATLCISKKTVDFKAITELLDLQPTKEWTQVHEHLKNTEFDYMSWNYSTEKMDCASVSDVVEILLERLKGKEDKIVSLYKAGHKISVVCPISILTDRPVYELSQEAISKLAEIKADFGMDIVDFSEDEDDEIF